MIYLYFFILICVKILNLNLKLKKKDMSFAFAFKRRLPREKKIKENEVEKSTIRLRRDPSHPRNFRTQPRSSNSLKK